ncbi:hypothetical protein N865_00045 [Intrasporangium oryzae NRRL B-24470]|uniref:Uncharacterized protein n=2 Tax=Intrasporangium TaxID=53357 RepID=W9G839_9MICO|nr:hypothetical protein N865_00045 [Intrasporangium oryzae NRRL B-24470]
MVGAWRMHTKPVPPRAARIERSQGTERAPGAPRVETVEAVMESAPAPARLRRRHPHLSSLGRRLHLVH